MKNKVGILVAILVLTLMVIATITAASDHFKLNQATNIITTQAGETQNPPAQVIVGTLTAVVLTTPAFGYIIIKNKKPA